MTEKRLGEMDVVTDRLTLETISGDLDTLETPYRYVHCTRCVREHPKGDVSLREWMRFEVGLTPTGFLIRCVRHEMPVVHLTPEAMQQIVSTHQHCDHPGCDHKHHG